MSEIVFVPADEIEEISKNSKAFSVCVEIAMLMDADLTREEAIEEIRAEKIPDEHLPLLRDQMRMAMLLKTQIEAFHDECLCSGLIHKLILDKAEVK